MTYEQEVIQEIKYTAYHTGELKDLGRAASAGCLTSRSRHHGGKELCTKCSASAASACIPLMHACNQDLSLLTMLCMHCFAQVQCNLDRHPTMQPGPLIH